MRFDITASPSLTSFSSSKVHAGEENEGKDDEKA